jgi:hypothetical protein
MVGSGLGGAGELDLHDLAARKEELEIQKIGKTRK